MKRSRTEQLPLILLITHSSNVGIKARAYNDAQRRSSTYEKACDNNTRFNRAGYGPALNNTNLQFPLIDNCCTLDIDIKFCT